MAKLALFMMVSLDGYIEGSNHDLSWHNVDQEFNDFAAKQLDEAGTLVFGGKTYQMMYEFWPSDSGKKDDPVVAEKMNSMPKIVISDVLTEANWNNTRLIKDNIDTKLKKLKEESAKDLLVLGSNNLCVSLLKMGLLDELRLMINPVVVGSGTPLFASINNLLKLKLQNERKFNSGNVLLTYSI